MILHALHDLYDRLEKDNAYDVAPEGYSMVSVSFLIELEPDGSATFKDHRTGEGNRRRGRVLCVPGPKAHSNAIDPFPLRDTFTYLLGFRENDSKPENSRKRFEASRQFHAELARAVPSPDIQAVCRFLEKWDPANLDSDPKWFLNSGVFRLRNRPHYAHECPEFSKWWKRHIATETPSGEERMCLITGKVAPVAATHTPPIGGNMPSPAQAKATIVSFNFRAADSYGNDSLQGLNSPVSAEAATRYCKSLNALLASDKHRLQIGDATTVFWTERPTAVEATLGAFFGGDLPDENESNEGPFQATTLLSSLHESLRSLRRGGKPVGEISNQLETAFFILGLTGQAGGRIGVRFWHRDTVGGLLTNLAKHHTDLAIVPERGADSEFPDPEFPTMGMLLRQTGRMISGKVQDIPPNLSGALSRSILQGADYPVMLAQRLISRIRVCEKDKQDKARPKVTYLRAAILKAFLNRNHHLNMKEALDPSRPEPAYHLGRLFAVYETSQRHAHDWKLERTIRESMYSSASATPLAVFGRLERLHHHHTAKKSHPQGSSESYRDIVGEIEQHFIGTPLYPASLNLVEQSLFAVGYYHQLHWFRTLAEDAREKKNAERENLDN